MAMFKAGGCYVRCQPLPTGADAVCLTEFLGAAFACVQWLEEKATQDYIYKIGLFYFESAAKKDEAHIALSTAFPGVVPEERWFASIGREEWLVMLEEKPPKDEWDDEDKHRSWDDSSDMTMVNLNCGIGDAIARARITIGCVVDCPRCIAPESHKTSHSLDCMGWMNNSSQVPECRPISSIGLPRHSITDEGDDEDKHRSWAFPALRIRLSMLSSPADHWKVFNARYKDTKSKADYVWLDDHQGWRALWDCLYILEEAVRKGLHVDAGFPDLLEKLHHRVDSSNSIMRDDIQQFDPRFAERLEASRRGFPTLTALSLQETRTLQLQAYAEGVPPMLQAFLEDVSDGNYTL